ncbi:hypothetical protein [Mycobacterium kyorinense]|nr:hypothetical protein [Mycobacterium kyorinense]
MGTDFELRDLVGDVAWKSIAMLAGAWAEIIWNFAQHRDVELSGS